MSGWKTWVAVIGAFAGGITLLANGLLADPVDMAMIEKGITALIGAFGLVGIGHKIEKNKK